MFCVLYAHLHDVEKLWLLEIHVHVVTEIHVCLADTHICIVFVWQYDPWHMYSNGFQLKQNDG